MSIAAVAAIVGAGTLGGTIAHTLAGRDRFARIRMIDSDRDVAAGKTLDIQQAAGVEPFRTQLTAHASCDAAADAQVVILAGPASTPDEDWSDDDGLAMLREICRVNQHAVIVCAGTGDRTLIGRAVADLEIPPSRLVGSAPCALQSALRAIVAVTLRRPASQVSLTVLGVPPGRIVVPWSTVTVGGFGLPRLLDPPAMARLQAKVPRVWPPGPYALASAAARVCASIVDGPEDRSVPCFVVLEGRNRTRPTVAALPVALDATGVRRIVDPALDVRERVELETALDDERWTPGFNPLGNDP